jgi:hypothetical protein
VAQFLRPDSTVTADGFTNGHAAIDEAIASDADFAYGANNTAAVLEVGLSNPTGTPASGTTMVRYRHAKVNSGALSGSGSSVTVTAEIYQGASLIASDAAQTAGGSWTARSWTPDMSGVTDWTDLRLRFTTSSSGGSPANRRGGAVSWAELEVPDPQQATQHQGAFAASGTGTFTANGQREQQGALATDGAGTFAANGEIPTGSFTGAAAFDGAGTFAAGGKRVVRGGFAASGAGSWAAIAARTLRSAFAAVGAGTRAFTAKVTAAGRAAFAGSGSLAAAGNVPGGNNAMPCRRYNNRKRKGMRR